MTIKIIKQELESATKPVLKPLHKNSGFNVFIIGMNNGMVLSSHKAKWPSKLTILQGKVEYIENGKSYSLFEYDEKEIQPGILHELKANEFSLCLLTQSKPEE